MGNDARGVVESVVGRVSKFNVVPDLALACHDRLPVIYPASFETRDGNPVRLATDKWSFHPLGEQIGPYAMGSIRALRATRKQRTRKTHQKTRTALHHVVIAIDEGPRQQAWDARVGDGEGFDNARQTLS